VGDVDTAMTCNRVRLRTVVRTLIALVALGGALVGPAAAQTDAKLGYVNSERLFADYGGFSDAQRAYQQELDGWMRELKSREQELTKLEAEFRAQGPMLSEERRREMETELQRGTEEYEQFRQSIFGQGGKAETRNQELLEPVLAEVQRAVEEVAEEYEYDLIFDAVDGNIIYGAERYDVTDLVLDKLREAGGEDGSSDDSGTTGGEGSAVND